MQMNRLLQEKILKHLTEYFPEAPTYDFFNQLIAEYNAKEVIGTILYLEMQGLLTSETTHGIGEEIPQIVWDLTRPTAQAFDFLANDGGLSAILGVVTVKLHSDTIQALLTAKIDEAKIPEEEKGRLKTELGKIKDSALGTLTENAINAVPAASIVAWLKTALGF